MFVNPVRQYKTFDYPQSAHVLNFVCILKHMSLFILVGKLIKTLQTSVQTENVELGLI